MSIFFPQRESDRVRRENEERVGRLQEHLRELEVCVCVCVCACHYVYMQLRACLFMCMCLRYM